MFFCYVDAYYATFREKVDNIKKLIEYLTKSVYCGLTDIKLTLKHKNSGQNINCASDLLNSYATKKELDVVSDKLDIVSANSYKNTSDIKVIKTDVKALTEDVVDVTARVTTAESDIDTVQATLETKADKGTFDNDTLLSNGTVFSNIKVTDGIVTGLETRDLNTDNIEPTATRRYVPEVPLVSPDTKFLNGNGLFTDISIGGSSSSGSTLYLTSLSSDVPTYYKLNYVADATELIKDVTVNSSADVLAGVFLFDTGIGVTAIDSGVWESRVNVKVDKTTGNTRIKNIIFARETNGTETDLFTRYSDSIVNTTFYNIATETNREQITVSPTARLGIRVYVTTTSVANVVVSGKIGGVDSAYLRTPLAMRHNQLRGKDEEASYQHITLSAKTDLTDGGDTTLHYHASDRARANHTGTQSASTISDFAASVRGNVLTGLSTATSSAITAADSVLSALGKLQAQITNHTHSTDTHKLLWSNSSPTSDFPAQTLSGFSDILSYDLIRVYYENSKNAGIVRSVDAPPISGCAIQLEWNVFNQTYPQLRFVHMYNDSFVVSAGYGVVPDDITMCIPLKIYGIKY